MSYLVKIGAIKENKSGVGSRGYHVYRRRRSVITVWGHIEVRPKSRFYWAQTTQHQKKTFSSENRAMEHKRGVVDRLIDNEGYSKLPVGVVIRRHARSAYSTLKK
jgi:hypothetical protein